VYTIRLGDHKRNVSEGTEQNIKAIKMISHENYNNPSFHNDIALIQLAKPATLNNRVGLVCLPDEGYVLPAGSNCYITGSRRDFYDIYNAVLCLVIIITFFKSQICLQSRLVENVLDLGDFGPIVKTTATMIASPLFPRPMLFVLR